MLASLENGLGKRQLEDPKKRAEVRIPHVYDVGLLLGKGGSNFKVRNFMVQIGLPPCLLPDPGVAQL